MRRNKKPLKPRPLFSSPVSKQVQKPKTKWKVLPIMWLALKRSAMLIGFMVILSMLISVYTFSFIAGPKKQPVPDKAALYLNFDQIIGELPQDPSLTVPFPLDQLTLRHYVSSIEMAKEDDRIVGIIAKLQDGASFSLAQVQEIRNALQSFKESGKFTYIYSDSYGGAGGGMSRYYLASAFDEIWMQPMGIVAINGVSLEVPFVREALNKIGVTPNFFKRKDYKTAYETFTNEDMSPENREMLERLVGDIRSEIVAGVSADREMSESQFTSLVSQGLFVADKALESKLIDVMDYSDVLLDKVREQVTGEPDGEGYDFMMPMKQYVELNRDIDEPKKGDKPGVALVYVVGAIMFGDTNAQSPSVLLNDGLAASNTIVPAIRDAMEDDDIDTIILRVDSPGGSPAASEAILRAVEKAQEAGKSVLVSMGGTAASGGYWVSAYADQIFVSPLTITGSIGVVGGKFVLGDMFDKVGANWEHVEWGRNAGMWSMTSTFDESEARAINAMLDTTYDAFLERVAKGRKMSVEQVDAIAGGRVWSGKQALDIGLADQEGGLLDAINYAATLAGKTDYHDVTVTIFPKPKTALEQFIAIMSGESASVNRTAAMQNYLLNTLQPVIRPAVMAQEPEKFMTYAPTEIR